MDNRMEFTASWLVEQPQIIKSLDTFNILINNLKERENIIPIKKVKNLYLSLGESVCYAWYEENHQITLICEFLKKPQNISITAIGKKSISAKHADELYLELLSVFPNIKIHSDQFLTEKGLNIWKRLQQSGHKISVFRSKNPELISLQSNEELEKYLNRDYQFVLSENSQQHINIKGLFNIYLYRKLSGIL